MPVTTPAQINIYSVTSANSLWGTAPVGNPSVLDVNACLFAGNIPLSTTVVGSPAVEGLNVYVLNPLSVTFPSSLPVTQSGVWNITSITDPVAVTGTFWQATQPVSGTVSVSNFTFTNYGSPAIEAANVYVVNPISVSFPASVAVTQSTSPWVVSGTVSVSNLPATQAVSNLTLSEMTFTSYGSPAVQALDVYVVNPSGGSGGASNITQWNSVNLGSPSNYGTPPGAVEVIGVNAYITNTVPVTGTFWQATQPVSGTVTADQGGVWNIGTITSITNPVAVTGTFWQATQPVSGTVAFSNTSIQVSNFPASQTVNGTVSITNLSFTNYGSPAVEAANVYVVNPVTFPGTVNVAGTVTADQGGTWTVGIAAAQTIAVTNAGTFLVQAAQSGAWNIGTLTSITNPVAVTGTFWQTTQPVSLASTTITGNVAVTGTFWQATQPVSGTVSVSNFPASQTVNGTVSVANLSFTNYGSPAQEGLNVYVLNPLSVTFTESTIGVTQSTSPWVVSGTVAVSNFPASQAVTGTFWQATQPVSGTFWQTTQPVSGTVAVSNFPSSQPVTGTFWQTTQPVSIANLSFTAYGSPAVEALDVYVVNPVAVSFPSSIAVTGTFWQATQPVSLASTTVTGSVAVTNAGTFAVQDTVLDAAIIAQEATTSGVKGLTSFGAVTTSAPTYSTGKSDALSLDTAGNLRTVLNAETTKVIGTVNQGTSPWVISGAVTLASTTVTGSVAVTGTFFQATQPVSIASGQVASGAIASGAVASGAIASGAIASGAIAAGAVAAGAFVSGSILSGALASGAVVDLTNVTSALAATAPTKAISTSLLAATALPTAVSGGQAIQPMVDKFGRQVCLTAGMRDILGASATTITASTSATSIVAAVASTYCDITSLTLTNSSATATLLTLSDGSTSYVFSAGAGPGWGITIPFNPPLPAASVNTAWTLTCGTSVSSVYAVAQYIKNR